MNAFAECTCYPLKKHVAVHLSIKFYTESMTFHLMVVPLPFTRAASAIRFKCGTISDGWRSSDLPALEWATNVRRHARLPRCARKRTDGLFSELRAASGRYRLVFVRRARCGVPGQSVDAVAEQPARRAVAASCSADFMVSRGDRAAWDGRFRISQRRASRELSGGTLS